VPKEKLNILLVDDDHGECDFFREALEKAHVSFELKCCYNVLDDVYFQLLSKDFDVIFLDINMPGETGVSFLKKIKSKEKFKDIPVIMYTVSAHDSEIEECYKLGAHYYLVKPYAELNLVESVRKIFETDLTLSSRPSIENFVINLAFA
jgi:CheY-like chemotaxis protein